MMRRYLILFFSLGLLAFRCMAQSNIDGAWQTYLSVNYVTQVENASKVLYAVAQDKLFVVSKSDHQKVHFFDRKSDASDIDVDRIAYYADKGLLLVCYKSGMVDMVTPEGVQSVSGLYDNNDLSNKSVNDISFYGDYALLSGPFGLSVISISQGEFIATAFKGDAVVSAIIHEGYIWAVKGGLVVKALFESNIQDPSQWSDVQSSETKWNRIVTYDGNIYVLNKSEQLFQMSDSGELTKLMESVQKIKPSVYGLVVVQGKQLHFYRNSEIVKTLGLGYAVRSFSANVLDDPLYVNEGWGIYSYDLSADNPDGRYIDMGNERPLDNKYFYMDVSNGRLYVVSGARTYHRLWQSGSVKLFDGTSWRAHSMLNLPKKTGEPFYDPISVAVDPTDPTHYFVGVWGEGLLEFRSDEYFERYSIHNSLMRPAIEGKSADHTVFIGSLAFDNEGVLWMAQGAVSNSILSLSPDGTFTTYSYEEITKVNSFNRMLVLPGGDKWLLINHRGSAGSVGVFVFNEKRSGGQSMLINEFSDRNGKVVSTRHYYDAAIDRKGLLWLGTDKGPIYVAGARSVLTKQQEPVAVRPVAGVEPNLYYVMDNIPVTAIAVDPMDNKWFGSASGGLYHVSADGREVLNHYTTDNSPLLSNTINSLTVDDHSGRLYIGTSSGLNSLLLDSNSIERSPRDITVYPNPLKPNDHDQVTLNNLPLGGRLLVVDVAGNKLLEDEIVLSEYTFMARIQSGERFPTGVYQIFIFDHSGKECAKVQLAVVN